MDGLGDGGKEVDRAPGGRLGMEGMELVMWE